MRRNEQHENLNGDFISQSANKAFVKVNEKKFAGLIQLSRGIAHGIILPAAPPQVTFPSILLLVQQRVSLSTL